MKSTLLAAAMAVLLGLPAAGAADLYEPQPEVYQAPAPVVQASGWYLRGDVSYDFNDVRGMHYQTPGGGTVNVGSESLDDSANIGLGAGYQFNQYLRADVTGDYMFKADFHGVTTTSACGAVSCVTNENSGVSLLSLLANAYVDLGTWYRTTPYVGAGIGATYVDWDNFAESGNCAACITNPGGEHDWRFTYALMAGASVDLTCNLKFDAGYRFRHIDGGDAFSDGFNSGFDDGFNVHEVRGGLRYSFGGCTEPQPAYAAYEPAPVYK